MIQLLYFVASLHVMLCPFTKVEESFNIQAVHDILYHRSNLSEYDHNEFPGVVPRTFIGPFVISMTCLPLVGIFNLFGFNKFWMQCSVRIVLAYVVTYSWRRLQNTVQRQFGSTFTWWFTLLSVTQYHFMFYMSRPLPNIMAMPLVLLALEGWISGNHKKFIISGGAAIIIFRAELAMLFGLYVIIDLYLKKINIQGFLKIVIPAGITLVTITILMDSIFWKRVLWPEAEVFLFNTVLNKSSEWGTSPFLWYFYSALPRGLGPSIVLMPIGFYLEKRLIPIVVPALIYILFFSFLPHKELRFIIYVFPLLNMSSAAVCSYIYVRRSKLPIYELLFWGTVVIIVCNVIFTLALSLVAMTNYPGGVAIMKFHKLMKNEPYVHVHIGNLAAQTGVTRFTQINDHWSYSKNESLSDEQLHTFTHLLIEAKSKYSSNLKSFTQTHTILDSVESFSHIALTYKLIPPIKIKTKPAIFILERKNFRNDPYGLETQKDEKVVEEPQLYDVGNINISKEIHITSDTENEMEQNVNQSEVIIVDTKVIDTQDRTVTVVDDETVQGTDENYVDSKQEPVKKSKLKRILEEEKINSRQERKKKAMSKMKSETRKEVVASAKQKLKEIMKRHKHIGVELSENNISELFKEQNDDHDGRGDIPDVFEQIHVTEESSPDENEIINMKPGESENMDVLVNVNVNIESIVEEVIVRLQERKMYDDKTKPEDIKAEDRIMIQKIVEEILSEKMSYKEKDSIETVNTV